MEHVPVDWGTKDKMFSFFYRKMGILFHDPPHKVVLLINRISHEKIIGEFLQKIKPYSHVIDMPGVKLADVLAAATDRMLMEGLLGQYIPGAFRYNKVKLKNPFMDPLNELGTIEIKQEELEKQKDVWNIFSNKIRNDVILQLHNRGASPKVIYEVLYLIYEPLWIACGGISLPADTRTPWHTIFDHLCAALTISNMISLSGTEINGFIVTIDLGGVQKFIAASRKTRDLWISSWLYSIIAWELIKPLLDTLGPDVLLIPSPRNNPLLLAVFLRKYHKKIEEIFSDSMDILYEYYGYVDPLSKLIEFPIYAIVPSTLTLILPAEFIRPHQGNIDDKVQLLLNFFVNRFMEVWSMISRTALEGACEVYQSKNKHTKDEVDIVEKLAYKNFDKLLRNSICKIQCMFNDIFPPIPLRIAITHVRGYQAKDGKWTITLKGFINGNLKNLVEEKHKDVPTFLLFDKIWCFHQKRVLASVSKHKVSPSIILPLTKYTEDLYVNQKSWRFCTQCNELPAVLEIPDHCERIRKGEVSSCDECQIRNPKICNKAYEGNVPSRFRSFFDAKEKLCGWCLIKRLLNSSRIVLKLIENLGYSVMNRKIQAIINWLIDTRFISTTDIANISAKIALAKGLIENKIPNNLKEALKRELTKFFGKIGILWEVGKISEQIQEMYNEIWNVIKHALPKEIQELLKVVFESRSEDAPLVLSILYTPFDAYINIVLREAPQVYNYIRQLQTTYFAIIRADTDNCSKMYVGELVSNGSEISGSLITKKTPIDWFLWISEGPLKDALKKVLEFIENRISFKDLVSYITNFAGIPVNINRGILTRFIYLINQLKSRGAIPISISLLTTFSRALMVTSMWDFKKTFDNSGIVVYAGGDDLLALSPIIIYTTELSKGRGIVKNVPPIRITIETRRKFIFGDDGRGFFVIQGKNNGRVYVPTLGTFGRTYVIYCCHHLYPFNLAIHASHEKLEEKDYISFRRDLKWQKDLLITLYHARGGKILTSIIPFTVRPIEENIDMILKPVELVEILLNLALQPASINQFGTNLTMSFFRDALEERIKEIIDYYSEKRQRYVVRKLLERIINQNLTRELGNSQKQRFEREVLNSFYDVSDIVYEFLKNRGSIIPEIIKACLILIKASKI